jgi:hypothetical protein
MERKKQNKQNNGKADRPRATVVFFFPHEAQLFLQIVPLPFSLTLSSLERYA